MASSSFFTTAKEYSKLDERTRLIHDIKGFCIEQNLLGRGKYGDVYRGQYEEQGVAIKKVEKLNLRDLEVEILNRLPNNRNVIKFIHILEDDRERIRYIIMERAAATMAQIFIEGDRKYKGPLPSDLRVLHQVASGLKFLHSKQIVHGDLKPENILISLLDNPVQMKLSDFGFSKQITSAKLITIADDYSSEEQNLIQDSAVSYTLSCVRGTPIWMAPELHSVSETLSAEQLKEAKAAGNPIKVSTAVDMYSFGLVSFWYLSRGVHPFGSVLTKKQRALIPKRIRRNSPTNLERLSIDHPARNLVLEMMQHDSKQRITASGVTLKLNPMIGVNHTGVHHSFSDTPPFVKQSIEKAVDEYLKSKADTELAERNLCWDHLITNSRGEAIWAVATSDSFWTLVDEEQDDIDDADDDESIKLFSLSKTHEQPVLSAIIDSELVEESRLIYNFIKKVVKIHCKDYNIKTPPKKPLISFEMSNTASSNQPEKIGLLFSISDIIHSQELNNQLVDDEELFNVYGLLYEDFSTDTIGTMIRLMLPANVPSIDDANLLTTAFLHYQNENLKQVFEYILLNDRVDVNGRTDDGLNALHIACRDFSGEKLIGFVPLLIDHTIDINAQTNDGSNALHLLTCRKDLEEEIMATLFALIINDTNVNARNNEGFSVLHSMCKNYTSKANLKDMIQLLIEHKVELNAKNDGNRNAIDYLCRYYSGDDLYEIIKLLIKHNIEVNSTRSNGLNALITACQFYHHEHLIKVVQLLLEKGIEVNASTKTGPNALIILCVYYHGRNLKEIIQILLNHKINVHYTTNDGFNALTALCHYYKGDNLIQIIRPLIEDHQIDVNVSAFDGQTILMKLCGHYGKPDLLDIVQLLVSKEIDVKAVDCEGANALLLLCRNYTGQNLSPVVRLLLENEVGVNVTSKNGWNALLTVVRYYNIGDDLMDIVQLLIEHEIDVNYKNDEGNALHLLMRFYRGPKVMDIVNILLRAGIDVNAKDKLGQNALMIAVRYCSNSNLLMEIAHSLMKRNIDTNCKIEDGGWNALHLLCRYFTGDTMAPIVRLLIVEGKIDVKAIYGEFRWNALLTACRYYGGNDLLEVVQLLVDSGIDEAAANTNGSSALHLLCQYYRGPDLLAIVRYLVGRNRIDVGSEDFLGASAVDMLLSFNRDLDRSDAVTYLRQEQLSHRNKSSI